MTYTKSQAWFDRNENQENKSRNIEICRLRFDEKKTLEEIGALYGITRERVRQITDKDVRADSFHRISPLYQAIIDARTKNETLGAYALARQFKVSPPLVYKVLKSAGLSPGRVPMYDRFCKRLPFGEPNECWPWQGAINKKTGYGMFSRGSRGNEYAHRAAYEILIGKIPDGLWVLHKCDNPPCCNPAHLFLGTPKDNTQDAIAKGRWKSGLLRGEDTGNAKLTEAQALEIKRALAAGAKPKDLVGKYPVGLPGIYSIKGGYAWGWLGI